jgi:hypothetical protein
MQEPEIPEVRVAATGSIRFEVDDGAIILLGGREVGVGPVLELDGLAAGDYRVRIEHTGRRTLEEMVSVTRGGSTAVRRVLEPWGDAAPTLLFASRPRGAKVLLDEVEVGVTPLTWQDGEPHRRYSVVMSLDGYQTFQATIDPQEEGAEYTVNARLQRSRVAAVGVNTPGKTGKLRVVLMGAVWAHVWVDGKKLSRTAPFADLELTTGRHVVRVENSAIGMRHEQTVTIAPGAQQTVRALAQ